MAFPEMQHFSGFLRKTTRGTACRDSFVCLGLGTTVRSNAKWSPSRCSTRPVRPTCGADRQDALLQAARQRKDLHIDTAGEMNQRRKIRVF